MLNRPDPTRLPEEDDLNALDRAWFFTREYPNLSPNALFDAVVPVLRDAPFFKVWKVDNSEKWIELTTHSIRLHAGAKNHQVQADLKILEGREPFSSIVNIRIMPTLIGVISLYEVFTNVDVNDAFAKHVANLIFDMVEDVYRR